MSYISVVPITTTGFLFHTNMTKFYSNDSRVYLSAKIRSGVSLEMYIILNLLHRNTAGESDLKAGLSHLHINVSLRTICHRLKTTCELFFLFIETITGRYIIYRIENCVSWL